MKTLTSCLAHALVAAATLPACAHLIGEATHDVGPAHYEFNIAPAGAIRMPGALLREEVVLLARSQGPLAPIGAQASPAMAAPFQAFAPKVKVRADDQFLYVESDGLPAHNMMTGISNWQQQVPLPQRYTGNNAWRIPLHPVASKNPVSIKGRFLRGAIALAANGIPIFNPQNNRGEVSQEIGELDQWGGHCGRADDYHYHAAPLHLQAVLGKSLPIACALDGYPIYGLTEPDGSSPAKLDAFNGHETPMLGYHYHASMKYPCVNGGFHGEVTERDGQVDPQPHGQPMRGAGTPMRGARITDFTAKDKSYSLKYEVGGETRFINYGINDDGTVKFDYVDGRGQVKSETYSPRPGGGERPPGEPKSDDGKKKGPPGQRPPDDKSGKAKKGKKDAKQAVHTQLPGAKTNSAFWF